jgi:acyl-coenzyme A thioesterase PaaI-like protein
VTETRLFADEATEPFAIGVTTYFLASEGSLLATSRPQMMPVWGGSYDAFLDAEVLGPDSISVPLVPRFQNSGPNSPMHGGLQSLLAEVTAARCFGSGRPMVATAIDIRYLTAATTGPVVAHTTGQRLSNGDVRAAVRIVDAGDGNRLATYASLTLHPVVD